MTSYKTCDFKVLIQFFFTFVWKQSTREVECRKPFVHIIKIGWDMTFQSLKWVFPGKEFSPCEIFLSYSCFFKSIISSYVADGVSQTIRTNIIQKITITDFLVFDNAQNCARDVIKCDVINSLILHNIVLTQNQNSKMIRFLATLSIAHQQNISFPTKKLKKNLPRVLISEKKYG